MTKDCDASQTALRILDANTNRAAEGLRTIEDYARLVRQDAVSAESIKKLRHQVAEIAGQLNRLDRLSVRSAETDAGTQHSLPSETTRPVLEAVVPAASERVTQALRCLEEFAKVLSPDLAAQYEQLRYSAYDVLAKTELRLSRKQFVQDAQLYLLIDCSLPIDEFVKYLTRLSEAGVDLVQLRDKQVDGRKLFQYGLAAAHALAKTSTRFILNDRVDVALGVGAAGVHLGQDDLSFQTAHRLAGARLCIGISTHTIEQAQEAISAGADYIGCGPTFPSRTKPFSEFAGTRFLEQVAQTISLPFFAIGGIDLSNLPDVIRTGCRRIAVTAAIHQASDPVQAASLLKRELALAKTGNTESDDTDCPSDNAR